VLLTAELTPVTGNPQVGPRYGGQCLPSALGWNAMTDDQSAFHGASKTPAVGTPIVDEANTDDPIVDRSIGGGSGDE